jgi:hypothetical protein
MTQSSSATSFCSVALPLGGSSASARFPVEDEIDLVEGLMAMRDRLADVDRERDARRIFGAG